MTNIVPFPEFVGIEITAGTVSASTITDEHGTRPVLTDIGKHFYYVNVLEPDGGRIGMWHGSDRDEATREADYLARDFGLKVIDRTGRPK